MTFQKRTRSILTLAAAILVAACASNTVASDSDSSGQNPGNSAGVNPPAGPPSTHRPRHRPPAR